MLTPEMIDDFMAVDLNTVNKDDLVDVSGFVFDNSIPQEQREAWIISAMKNPFCYRVGDMGVKLEFTEDAPPLEERLISFLKRQKSGL